MLQTLRTWLGDPLWQLDTASKLRTVPLWGLRMHPRLMHDLKSLTLESPDELFSVTKRAVSLVF